MSKNAGYEELTVLIVEDDDGHAELVVEHLKNAGVHNDMIRFRDGEGVLKFLFEKDGSGNGRKPDHAYLLLLDIRMPRVDGLEVLGRVKNDPELQNMPVIMLTTTDDPREVERCYQLGCNAYVTKPVSFQTFAETLRRLGLFMLLIRVPKLK